jgi:hypothetical protein
VSFASPVHRYMTGMMPLFITTLLDRASMPLPTGASFIVAASLGAVDASAMSPPLLPLEVLPLVLLPLLLEVLPLALLPPLLEGLPLVPLPLLLEAPPLVPLPLLFEAPPLALLPLLLALVPPLLALPPMGKFVLSDPQPLDEHTIRAKSRAKREPEMTERSLVLGMESFRGLKAPHRTARQPAGTHHRQLGHVAVARTSKYAASASRARAVRPGRLV